MDRGFRHVFEASTGSRPVAAGAPRAITTGVRCPGFDVTSLPATLAAGIDVPRHNSGHRPCVIRSAKCLGAPPQGLDPPITCLAATLVPTWGLTAPGAPIRPRGCRRAPIQGSEFGTNVASRRTVVRIRTIRRPGRVSAPSFTHAPPGAGRQRRPISNVVRLLPTIVPTLAKRDGPRHHAAQPSHAVQPSHAAYPAHPPRGPPKPVRRSAAHGGTFEPFRAGCAIDRRLVHSPEPDGKPRPGPPRSRTWA